MKNLTLVKNKLKLNLENCDITIYNIWLQKAEGGSTHQIKAVEVMIDTYSQWLTVGLDKQHKKTVVQVTEILNVLENSTIWNTVYYKVHNLCIYI